MLAMLAVLTSATAPMRNPSAPSIIARISSQGLEPKTICAPNGWFVVGAGRNGMEYSVLIVACLAAVFLADRAALRVGRGPEQ